MTDDPERVYYFKHYRRTQPGGTTGELIRKVQIRAYGLMHANEIAVRDYVAGIDFKSDFAILDGESGFIKCWFTGKELA